MKKLFKKSVLLFAAAVALCAFARPSMAPASSWALIGTEHTLDSSDFGFVNDAIGVSSMCARAQMTVEVMSTAVIEITTASFTGCTLTSSQFFGTCTMTSVGTNFPWTATARSTSDIQIHGVNILSYLENHPGSSGCTLANSTLSLTGTLSSARWLGNAPNPRQIELAPSTGLALHSSLFPIGGVTMTGTFTDTQETLAVTN